MAEEKKFRRGTTAEMAAFTGAEGELTVDTTKDTLVIHDGTTVGGFPLARENLSNVSAFGGASAGSPGTKGVVPAPAAGDQDKALYGDGTWKTVDAAPTDAQIETAYNNRVAKVSAGEITAGTETTVRRYSPTDIVAFVTEHGAAGTPGPEGDSAYQVAVNNGFVGTEPQWLASLVGADGPQGATGAPGADGADGAPGATGAAGADGADGKSAYQIAVDGGFVGTEAQWLASLVGPQGPAGNDGADGAQGPAGADGAQGIPGEDGTDGAPGASAYQVAVAQGFIGDEAAWLASLVGATGAAGADGADGTNGTNGKSAYEVAVDGGFVGTEAQWLASLVGPAGADGDDGAQGAAGVDGRTILNGTVAPTTEGANGDFYINTATSTLYGPKTAGDWGTGVSLVGAQGATGSDGTDGKTILSGTTAPGAGLGNDGDIYLDTATSTLYGPKNAGAWGSGVSLVGADGADGTNGTNGKTIITGTVAPTTEGVDGDIYINTATSTLYGPKTSGAWGSGTSLIGPAGADGDDGTNGTNGKTIISGTVAPTTEGVDGDYYINTTTYDLYGPKTSGAWGSATSLIGPAGTNGQGVPTGGTTGQILSKNSNTNYDTVWINAPEVGVTSSDSSTVDFSGLGTSGSALTASVKRSTTISGNLITAETDGLSVSPLVTLITDSTTARTAAATDAHSKYIRFTNASTKTFTIPTNASVAIPVGSVITFINAGAGNLTISPSGGVTVNKPAVQTFVLGQYGTATITKVGTDEWDLAGGMANA